MCDCTPNNPDIQVPNDPKILNLQSVKNSNSSGFRSRVISCKSDNATYWTTVTLPICLYKKIHFTVEKQQIHNDAYYYVT